jgi:sulfur relay (sulfurtransferase) complex TusBCD TusD component (DsrE family)
MSKPNIDLTEKEKIALEAMTNALAKANAMLEKDGLYRVMVEGELDLQIAIAKIVVRLRNLDLALGVGWAACLRAENLRGVVDMALTVLSLTAEKYNQTEYPDVWMELLNFIQTADGLIRRWEDEVRR